MKIDKERLVFVGMKKLPDNIKYKRGNIFLIILGYVFAVIAGVNGIEGVHDILYNLTGHLYLGWVNRLVAAVQVLCIYGICHWGFTYALSKEYTPDEHGDGFYQHPKYDSFTRVNGVCILFLFIIVAFCRGYMLTW